MTVVVLLCGVLLTAAGVCAVLRAERGPSMLDRTVALDIVLMTIIAAGALYAAVERRTDIVPILVVLSLVGFVESVTIARFASVEPRDEGRLRTPDEVAAEIAEQLRLERLAEEAAHPRPDGRAAPAGPESPSTDGEPT